MLPREIQTENWPDRATYDFPMRPIGRLHLIGLLPMGFAVLFVSVPARFALGLLRQAASGKPAGFEWIAIGFLCLFILAAMVPFCFGLFILAGRTRIVVVRRERIVVTEVAGLIRRSRKLRCADIARLEIADPSGAGGTGPATPLAALPLGALTAVMHNGSKRMLLLGYPRDWLDGMAEELSSVLQLSGKPVVVSRLTALQQSPPGQAEEVLDKPAGSPATLLETSNGLELTIPSRGLFKESGGMIVFGILWCVVLGFVTCMMVLGAKPVRSHKSFTPLGACIFLGGFWAAGFGMVLAGVHLGTRRWRVQADAQDLRISLQSSLRKRDWHWPVSEVENVSVVNSNVTVNNRRLLQLEVRLKTGKRTGLLAGRDADELAWIASVLRRSLGVPVKSENMPPDAAAHY